MNGTFTWIQNAAIRFIAEAIEVEIRSEFRVYEVNDEYYMGNAHLFYIPQNAREITCEECIRSAEGSPFEVIGIYNEGNSQLLRRNYPPQLRVYPTTKSFQDIKTFRLNVRYRCPQPHNDLQKQFDIPVHFTYPLRSYMDSLRCGESETLNSALLSIYAPIGCKWAVEKITLNNALEGLHALDVENDLCSIDTGLVKVAFTAHGERILARPHEEVTFNLPATQNVETIQARIDDITRAHQERAVTEVVVFVCDLRGSSTRTEVGKAPPDLLRFRNIWGRQDVKPFRLVNIIGDQALVVSDPDPFLSEGLNEIISLYTRSLDLGFPIRGGFHVGLAEATGETHRMGGYCCGEEFLGDAINNGAKAGDYKKNEKSLLGTEQFVRWFEKQRDASAFSFWEEATLGSWGTRLYKVDVSALQHTAQGRFVGTATHPTSFPDRLVMRASEVGSRLIVGLDPNVDKFPMFLQQEWRERPTLENLADIIFRFNQAIIEATKVVAVAYKPQAAFYEQYGMAGLLALQRTVGFLRKQELIVILDAKRNDIAHTAKAYAEAWLSSERPLTFTPNEWRVDAITINGYLGRDGVEPFLAINQEAGLFVLAKTSNQSSQEIQDCQLIEGGTVYEKMASLANEWGADDVGEHGYSRLGLVVGATYPEATKRLRKIAPKALFLMPGLGVQGGDLESIAEGAGADTLGAYAASSRSVLYNFTPEETNSEDWGDKVGEGARKKAEDLNDVVMKVLRSRR
ncbi:MAG: orotidine-5'-phosphate decarboxylase [Nitrososphaera sp.]|nr:orotidine-5'-phosphate decarboxylase [Nitrososphaera sp.]